LQLLEHARLSARGENVIAFGRQHLDDFYYLLGRFARAIYHFRKAAPDLPMMVHCREAGLLERQMPQPFNRLVDIDLTVLYLLQQLFYLFRLNK
jgi:hypothetical protein